MKGYKIKLFRHNLNYQNVWKTIKNILNLSYEFKQKTMETKLYQTAKEFFKFLNNYEADIWIRGSKAYNVNGELVAEYNTKF